MGKAIRECQKMYNVVRYSLTLGRGKSKGEFGGKGGGELYYVLKSKTTLLLLRCIIVWNVAYMCKFLDVLYCY